MTDAVNSSPSSVIVGQVWVTDLTGKRYVIESVGNGACSLRRLDGAQTGRLIEGVSIDGLLAIARPAGRSTTPVLDEDRCPACGEPSADPPAEVYCVECATEGWQADAAAWREARNGS